MLIQLVLKKKTSKILCIKKNIRVLVKLKLPLKVKNNKISYKSAGYEYNYYVKCKFMIDLANRNFTILSIKKNKLNLDPNSVQKRSMLVNN